jgi:uncharacterized protein YbbC (DUF1343 family)
MAVRTGLARIADADPLVTKLVRGARIGLVAHPASVDEHLRHAVSVLTDAGARIEILFGPEHGFAGQAQDMIHVEGDAQPSGPQIRSLYGATYEALSPREEDLGGLDAVVIDLQDVGARYYTFVWTATLVLEVCARVGVRTIVLDRPNPLGGEITEGAPQREGYQSFVGLHDVPVRHGLTICEIVRRVARSQRIADDAYDIVRMEGYSRAMLFGDTGLPWVLPSPNMPTPDTALVYPGGCVIEGTRLSEGRGTTRPFELWGAPHLDGTRLAREVSIEGAVLRPMSFQPTFQKHAGRLCHGVQVHVTNPATFRSYEAYLRLIAKALEPLELGARYRTEEYEYVTDRLAIDLLTGGPEYRNAVDAGEGLEDVLRAEREGAARFEDERREAFLYG